MTKTLWILALLLGAQVNVTALVPAAAGQAPPPWWVGGGLLWPFFADTRTLLPRGDALSTLTPILGIAAGACFLLAAASLCGWVVPSGWFSALVIAGVICSSTLQVIWFSGWAVMPLVLDAVLLCAVVAKHATLVGLRA
ncbi:MAG: hypothetical protein Q7U75_14955 [Desulfobacterales bacterium]|nr:hypothetical protein [Desulfobacterales bacterium]